MTVTDPDQLSLPGVLDWVKSMCAKGVVHYDEGQESWQVVGYAEVSHMLSNPQLFSSELTRDGAEPGLYQTGNLTQMDPPQHRVYRTLLARTMSPKLLAGLEPRIAEITGELLDSVADRDRFDLIGDLAYPLPVLVVAELLGLSMVDRELYRRWARNLFEHTVIDTGQSLVQSRERALRRSVDTIAEMRAYLLEFVADRRRGLGATAPPAGAGDILADLMYAEVDGRRLSDEELTGYVGLLLLAGHATTTAAIGNTVVCFDEFPEDADRVRADPSLLPSAIEEALRYRPIFPRLARRATTELELGGRLIRPDEVVVPWVVAANRDPEVFQAPERFDIHRTPNPHLSFGRGIHFCIGALLARLETRIVLKILLERYRSITLAPEVPAELRVPWIMVSADELPVRVAA